MSHKKILIVDNDKVILRLIESLLRKKGHLVKTASDAFEALDIVRDFTPDIIFTDLVMPKISGDKLCTIFRLMERLENCYIVIISATLAEEMLDLEKIGANAAIVKGPFALMSQYITETISESENTSTSPVIKGTGQLSPRHITQELISENKYLHKLLEVMSQGILELENNRVLYANSSAANILKMNEENLLGIFLNESLDIHIWEKIGPKISTCKDSSDMEEHNQPLELYDRQIILQCLQFAPNKNRRIVLLNDITSRKRMEAIIEATNLTENLGYIFSGIRHEIGNPVNSIKMALTVLLKNLDVYDKQTIGEFLDRSLEEVVRLEYLLKALKNYSLFEKPIVQEVNIEEFIDNFIPLVKEDLLKKRIDIRTKIEQGQLIALTDTRALHHVMLNLLTNAADSVEEREEPSITFIVKKVSPYIEIKVDDNGFGIAEDDKNKIFNPFFTSKPQGTGLGLAIVRKMLLGMKSKITIDSIKDFGTTVTLKLPEATT